jgi:hypothetical protein
MKKNQVKASSLIKWLKDDINQITEGIGSDIIVSLLTFGKYEYSLTIKDMFDYCMYIPSHICVNTDIDEEYSTDEVELIDDITKSN